MSGPNTYAGLLVRIPAQSLDDDEPLSVYRAWALRNNLQHLVDMYPQHRVNWAGHSDNDQQYLFTANDYGSPGGTIHYWSAVFLHTWIHREYPCGLDIQICGKTDDGAGNVSSDMHVKASVSPHVIGGTVLDTVTDPMWEDSGHITLATSEEVISSIYYPDTTSPVSHGWRKFPTVEDGKTRSVNICLSRLDIEWKVTGSDDSSSTSGLTRVSVREFC